MRFGEVLATKVIYVRVRERLQETLTAGVEVLCFLIYIYFLCLITSTFNWERVAIVSRVKLFFNVYRHKIQEVWETITTTKR